MKRVEASEAYHQLLDKVCWSHQHGRNVFHLDQTDIDLARLFAYGYRSQTIGAFHATRMALEKWAGFLTNANARWYVALAMRVLLQLENEAVQAVPRDFRAAVSTLYRYDQWTNEVAEFLQTAISHQGGTELDVIRGFFLTNLDSVIGGNGLYVANDTRIPQQGAFQVPNLNITIVPVIYGDFHSWNFASLTAHQSGVPIHRHRAGAEIHLGLSHVNGSTVLGNCEAEVREGYAMPIPPNVEHGFYNHSGHTHILPFIFGSLGLGGWGVFFDVEPRQDLSAKYIMHELESLDMNHSVWLERAIERIKSSDDNERKTIVPAGRTSTPETGGLELSVGRVTLRGTDITHGSFRIVSVVRGKARVKVGPAEVDVSEHDHFGVPADLPATIRQIGDKPLVMLDAVIVPHPSVSSADASRRN